MHQTCRTGFNWNLTPDFYRSIEFEELRRYQTEQQQKLEQAL
jgi:hypothetical protein